MRKALLCLIVAAAGVPAWAQRPKSEADLKADLAHARSKGQVQNALVDLDVLYQRERNWEKQAATLKQLVDFWSTQIQANSIGVARYSAELGKALRDAGDYAGSEQYLRSSIDIFRANGPLYAAAANVAKWDLAATLRQENKSQAADELSASLPPRPPPTQADHDPVVISKPVAKYTADARKHSVSGFLLLSVTLDETGQIQDVKLIAPLGFGLDQSAIENVRKWKFSPATLNGSPVRTRATVEVNFRLLS